MKKIIRYSGYFVLMLNTVAYAEIVTDGSMGAQTTVTPAVAGGKDVTIPQTLGTTVGANLFHSFSTFNINTGESATFTGSNAIHNVISRVTGTSSSYIDGLLKSEIGTANFYFINPNGVTFGANAEVNVPAAFYVSTANTLKLADGGQFSTSLNANASQLTIAEPASFGFVASNAAPGTITLDGSQLLFAEGKAVGISANTISIKNAANLTAPAGEIRLAAIKGTADVSLETNNLPSPTADNGGDITLNNSDLVSSSNVDSSSGGLISLWGGNITLENESTLLTHTFGKIAGYITVKANNLNMIDGSSIQTSTRKGATGDAGNIDVVANTINLDGKANADGLVTGITSGANDSSGGNGGKITVIADTLNMQNVAAIRSNTLFNGNAGVVDINVNSLTIDGYGNSRFTGISSLAAVASRGGVGNASTNKGDGGTVFINAKDNLTILNGGQITSSTFTLGKAGEVNITAGTVVLDGKNAHDSNNLLLATGVNAQAISGSKGDAGNVTIKATKSLWVTNSASINSSTNAQGKAGNVIVDSPNIMVDNNADISALAGKNSSGQPGQITLQNANILTLSDGGKISEQNDGFSANPSQVELHNLVINVPQLILSNGGTITTATNGNVRADNVIVTTQSPLLMSTPLDMFKSSINSSTSSTGNAGNVTVTAPVIAMDHAEIVARTTGAGNGGVVTVNASTALTQKNDAAISASSEEVGRSGNVIVTAPIIVIDNSNISARAKEKSSGQIGNITITASKLLSLVNHGLINLENQATVSNPIDIKAGLITISATDIALQDSLITAASRGNVDAGNITANFTHQLTMDPSFITTSANTGNGGDITIHGGELINLQNSGFSTSVFGATGRGGDINVSAHALIMNNALIQANAVGGSGGDINLKLQNLIPSQNLLIKGGVKVDWLPFEEGLNVIQAASQRGVNGAINVTSPKFNISGSLTGLTTGIILPTLTNDPCLTSGASSLARAGKGGLPDHESKTVFVPILIDKVAEKSAPKADSSLKSAPALSSFSLKDNSPCEALSANSALR